MKSVLFLLIASAMSISLTAADSSLTAYNSAFAKRTAAVDAANKECLRALLPLTKTAKGEMLTMVWQGIKEIDPQNEEATKALAAVPATDILGLIDPKTTLNVSKAQLLEKMIKSGKYTEKDWEAMPGDKVYSIGAEDKKELLPIIAKHVYILVPNPGDLWRYKDIEPAVNYTGANGKGMALCWLNVKDIKSTRMRVKDNCIIKGVEGGQYRLTSDSGGAGLGLAVGTIRVKLYEVIP